MKDTITDLLSDLECFKEEHPEIFQEHQQLIHDAIAILAVFMFFGLEISPNVVMAILAILGYSINDTIVIFTQIRKNLKKMNNSSIYEIVNTSINQMLRRTLLTSISTGLTVTALLIIGGETLRNLSIALLVGIIFGTYSSIYIASMIMMLFYQKKDKEHKEMIKS